MGLNLEPSLRSFGETDPNHELTHIISHPEYIVQIIRIVEKTFLDHITALLVHTIYGVLVFPSHHITSVLLAIARQRAGGS